MRVCTPARSLWGMLHVQYAGVTCKFGTLHWSLIYSWAAGNPNAGCRSPKCSSLQCISTSLTVHDKRCVILTTEYDGVQIALHSFGAVTSAVMGAQQFGAFYIAAGLASSCAAIVGRSGL